jgi:hypothetical protein
VVRKSLSGNGFGKSAGNFQFVRSALLALQCYTEFSDQTLRQDPFDSAGNQIGFNAHINESCERTGGVVCVQRAEHKMTGERCLDGCLRSFTVANFPDQDDVRVMSQNASQRTGKVSPMRL